MPPTLSPLPLLAAALGLALGPVLARASLTGSATTPGAPAGTRDPTRLACGPLCATAFATLALRFGATLECAEALGLAGVLVIVALADLDRRVIPNRAVLAAVLMRLSYLLLSGLGNGRSPLAGVTPSLLAGLAVATPALALALGMGRLLGRQSLGGGDVKLLFVVGLCFGVREGLVVVLLSCCLAVGLCLLRLARARGAERARRLREPFAFGPAICLSCWAVALAAPQVSGWYA